MDGTNCTLRQMYIIQVWHWPWGLRSKKKSTIIRMDLMKNKNVKIMMSSSVKYWNIG